MESADLRKVEDEEAAPKTSSVFWYASVLKNGKLDGGDRMRQPKDVRAEQETTASFRPYGGGEAVRLMGLLPPTARRALWAWLTEEERSEEDALDALREYARSERDIAGAKLTKEVDEFACKVEDGSVSLTVERGSVLVASNETLCEELMSVEWSGRMAQLALMARLGQDVLQVKMTSEYSLCPVPAFEVRKTRLGKTGDTFVFAWEVVGGNDLRMHAIAKTFSRAARRSIPGEEMKAVTLYHLATGQPFETYQRLHENHPNLIDENLKALCPVFVLVCHSEVAEVMKQRAERAIAHVRPRPPMRTPVSYSALERLIRDLRSAIAMGAHYPETVVTVLQQMKDVEELYATSLGSFVSRFVETERDGAEDYWKSRVGYSPRMKGLLTLGDPLEETLWLSGYVQPTYKSRRVPGQWTWPQLCQLDRRFPGVRRLRMIRSVLDELDLPHLAEFVNRDRFPDLEVVDLRYNAFDEPESVRLGDKIEILV